jgi:CRP-like cAMP-binding protein
MYLSPNNNLNIDVEFLKMIETIGFRKKVSKNSTVLQEGQTCDFFFYVVNGAFRAYRFIEDIEITIGFSFKGDIDTCPSSYVNNIGSKDIIQALVNSEIIKVHKRDYLNLIRSNPKIEDKTTILLGSYIEILIQRHINHRLFTAEELYLELLKRNPIEIRKIPKSFLASYLGVSPERISRIRKKNLLT